MNFDVTGIYNVNDWFIQFGAGVGLSEDNGTYQIDYAQYDSIGYYYEVTGFIINPETGEPIYKTDVKDVYDEAALKEWAASTGLTVERTRGDRGETTKYFLKDENGQVYRPTKQRQQVSARQLPGRLLKLER